MARRTNGICALNVVTRSATLDITPGERRMKASTRASSERRKPGLVMRRRTNAGFRQRAGLMAAGTESVLVACRAIELFRPRVNRMCVPVIQIVHHLQSQLIRRAGDGMAWRRVAHQAAQLGEGAQFGPRMTVLAKRLIVTLRAGDFHRSGANHALMVFPEIRAQVVVRDQRSDIGMAGPALDRLLLLFVTIHAQFHGGHRDGDDRFDGINTGMTADASNLMLIGVEGMREHHFPFGLLHRPDIRCVGVAIRAIARYDIAMTR